MDGILSTATIISLVIGYVLPLVSSFLARQTWPGELIGILTTVLAALTGFLTEWGDAAQGGDSYDWRKGALNALGTFVVAAIARRQSWAGTKTDAKVLSFGSRPKPYRDYDTPQDNHGQTA